MNDEYVEALRRLVNSTEGGRAAVASAIHGSDQSLYQILEGVPLKSGKPRSVGRNLRERLTRVFPDWLTKPESQSPLKQGAHVGGGAVALDLSQQTAIVPPTTREWADVLETESKEVFRLKVLDDAMVGKEGRGLRPGDWVHFDPARAPKAGDVVLLVDRDKNVCIRTYKEHRKGHWEACATNPNFGALDSVELDLRVLAVQCGHTW
jgi:SOS-response transcriptional repressor LexA